jgi:hypothetical protein
MNRIDDYINSLPRWQKSNLELFRNVIHDVVPSITEDWKWNVPVFIHEGKVYFAMSGFKAHTKYNFMANGALLEDPKKLFNNGFESKKSRGIDLLEDQKINVLALKDLVKSSVNN